MNNHLKVSKSNTSKQKLLEDAIKNQSHLQIKKNNSNNPGGLGIFDKVTNFFTSKKPPLAKT